MTGDQTCLLPPQPHQVMLDINTLMPVLQAHLHWHPSRLRFLALFLTALIRVTTVNLTKVANAFSAQAQAQSNYRRIQRFLAHFSIDYSVFARLLLALIPGRDNYVISIDRTNWKFGKTDINILMAAVVYQGTAFPLVWRLIATQGSSNVDERTEVLEALLGLVPAPQIAALVADREFIGGLWFERLIARRIPFFIRIKANTRVTHERRCAPVTKPAKKLFQDLSVGQARALRKARQVWGHRVYLSAVRTDKSLIIVASNAPGIQALAYYRQRWGIEVLFGSLKRRGFDFERTHLQHRERIEKLVALLALAFAWAHRIGQWLARRRPIRLKTHGRRARSVFRLGLDHLQYVLLHRQSRAFETCLWLLIDPLILALLDDENGLHDLNF